MKITKKSQCSLNDHLIMTTKVQTFNFCFSIVLFHGKVFIPYPHARKRGPAFFSASFVTFGAARPLESLGAASRSLAAAASGIFKRDTTAVSGGERPRAKVDKQAPLRASQTYEVTKVNGEIKERQRCSDLNQANMESTSRLHLDLF